MNSNQPALISAAIGKMGQGARLIIATDNDAGGHVPAGQIEALAREDLRLVRDLPTGVDPTGEGSDWNDVLLAGSPAVPGLHRP